MTKEQLKKLIMETMEEEGVVAPAQPTPPANPYDGKSLTDLKALVLSARSEADQYKKQGKPTPPELNDKIAKLASVIKSKISSMKEANMGGEDALGKSDPNAQRYISRDRNVKEKVELGGVTSIPSDTNAKRYLARNRDLK